MSDTTRLTWLLGIANPTPDETPPRVAIDELMPMTSPRELHSAPPELPRLIVASVWIASIRIESLCVSNHRPFELTMPTLTELSKPSWFPTASTHSPTSMSSLSPNAAGTRLVASTLMTAMSLSSSNPTTFASYPFPSLVWTRMLSAARATALERGSRTTCAFVMM